ncbi:MAG TPA: hypothetical protein P5013_03360 [Methanoregula sp.]|nr:hypothetical protein [Methanoregula sp.]
MRFSHISLIAVMLVVIAVALAGCASTGPAPQSTVTTTAAGTSPGSSSSVTQTAAVSGSGWGGGSDLFGGLNYNWVEYKMSTGTGSDAMTIYMKYDKAGKCSMRFEGAGAADLPSGMQEMDCSAKPGQESQSNPNQVSSDAVITCSPLDESVTVPAGTFSATKCTVISQGYTSTTWVAKGKFMVKMEGSAEGESTSMVLNAYG